MVIIDDLKIFFNLNGTEETQIKKCIKLYSRNISFSNVIDRIYNIILSCFGTSEWQVARKTLNRCTFTYLKNEYGEKLNNLSINARKLSREIAEFVLRYQTTRISLQAKLLKETSAVQYLISEAKIEKILDSSFKDIVDKIVLQTIYKREYKLYQNDINLCLKFINGLVAQPGNEEHIDLIKRNVSETNEGLKKCFIKNIDEISLPDLQKNLATIESTHKYFSDWKVQLMSH